MSGKVELINQHHSGKLLSICTNESKRLITDSTETPYFLASEEYVELYGLRSSRICMMACFEKHVPLYAIGLMSLKVERQSLHLSLFR